MSSLLPLPHRSAAFLALMVEIYALVSKCQKLPVAEQLRRSGQGKPTRTQSSCISKLSGLPTAPTQLLTVDFFCLFFFSGEINLLGLH